MSWKYRGGKWKHEKNKFATNTGPVTVWSASVQALLGSYLWNCFNVAVGLAACPRSEARERQMFVCLFIGRFSASFQSFGPILRLLPSQKKLCVVSFAELQLLRENTVLHSSGMSLKHFKSRLLGVLVFVLARPQVPVCFPAHPKPALQTLTHSPFLLTKSFVEACSWGHQPCCSTKWKQRNLMEQEFCCTWIPRKTDR